MYKSFFDLRHAPFSISPDPNYLFMSQGHREALAHLFYGLEAEGGFVLLTGEIGCGKTTVCRCLLKQTPPSVRLAYILNPRLDALEMLQTICEEFRIALPPPPHSIKTLTDLLNGFLLKTHAAGRHSVLIIDEAQNLSVEVLEQLRLLTNLETDDCKLLRIMLIGQPELRDKLEQPALEQLAQRVVARYHLDPLNLPETQQYVEHRLRVAGLKGPVPFSDAAIEHIHRLAQGVPRRINLLCDRALLGAYAKQQTDVDDALVQQAAPEVLGRKPIAAARRSGLKTKHWWGMGASAVLALALGTWWLGRPVSSVAARPPSPAASSALSGPQTANPSFTASEDGPSKDNASTDVPALAQLPDTQAAQWQALGRGWGLQLPPQGDPCPTALAHGVQCIRVSGITPAALQQFDRPGLLLLKDKGAHRWVTVEALRHGQWHLRAGDRRWTVAQADLGRWWQGDYASLWRLPQGQLKRLFTATANDPAGRWLDEQLRRLQAQGQLTAEATDFPARVRAFQKLHGLRGDGKAVPSTFLMINRLTGVPEPRLQSS